MKDTFEVGDWVRATSKYAFGAEQLERELTVTGQIERTLQSQSGPLGPVKYRIRDGWFYGSEMMHISPQK